MSLYSLEPFEMKQLVTESKKTWQSLGAILYGPTESEKKTIEHRQSIYVIKDINAGEILAKNNIRVIRPGLGLEPKYFDLVLGRRVKYDLIRGTALKWKMIL